mgnify:CR=1 FL=1
MDEYKVETPLDAIERRAKALGWVTDRHGPEAECWLDVRTPGHGTRHYRQKDGVLMSLVGTTGHVCRHDRALLESDGDAVETLRMLHGQLAQVEAVVADMRRQVERLTALVTGGGA